MRKRKILEKTFNQLNVLYPNYTDIDTSTYKELINTSNFWVVASILADQRCPDEVIHEFLFTEQTSIRDSLMLCAVSHPNISLKTLKIIVTRPNLPFDILLEIVKNPKCDAEILKILIQNPLLKKEVEQHKNYMDIFLL